MWRARAYRRIMRGACVTLTELENGGVDGAVLPTESTHLLHNLCSRLFWTENNTCSEQAIQPLPTISPRLSVRSGCWFVSVIWIQGSKQSENTAAPAQGRVRRRPGTMRSTVSSNSPVHRWNWRRTHRTIAVHQNGEAMQMSEQNFFFLPCLCMSWVWSHPLQC